MKNSCFISARSAEHPPQAFSETLQTTAATLLPIRASARHIFDQTSPRRFLRDSPYDRTHQPHHRTLGGGTPVQIPVADVHRPIASSCWRAVGSAPSGPRDSAHGLSLLGVKPRVVGRCCWGALLYLLLGYSPDCPRHSRVCVCVCRAMWSGVVSCSWAGHMKNVLETTRNALIGIGAPC